MAAKRAYFSRKNLPSQSALMLRRVGLKHPLKKQDFDPGQAALLILDMQNYFLRAESHAFIPSAPAILSNLIALAKEFARAGRPVISTRHVNTSRTAGLMVSWWRGIIDPASPMSEIDPRLRPHCGDVLEKYCYDAFFRTPLQSYLRRRRVQHVVVGGVMTHLCCETTARSAFQRGFQVFFLVDGTATYDSDYHAATLLNLNHGFASLVLAREILAKMKGLT